MLKKLNYQISKNDIEHIITCTPDIIERVLKASQNKIRSFVEKKKNGEGESKEEGAQGHGSKEAEFNKASKNQELKEVLGEKDTAIKELKSTVEVLYIIEIDFITEDPEDGAVDKDKGQQDPVFGEQTATGGTGMMLILYDCHERCCERAYTWQL